MLLLEILSLVISTPFASVYLSSISYKIAFLIFLLSVQFSCNTLHGLTLLTEVDLLGGLLQTSQYLSMYDTVLSFLVPIMIYHNAETEKSCVITENKGKAGIYLWTHKESGKMYIGSAVDLSKRFYNYYNINYLNRHKFMYIYNALLLHGYSTYSLTILEYIDISHLDKKQARELILCREQYYIDTLLPVYNINPTAGSRLGSLNSAETLAKMSEIKSGKTHSAETKAKMSEAHKGKFHSAETKIKMSLAQSGENHPMYGCTHSTETKTLMSAAKSGQNHPMFGRTGDNHPMFGKTHTPETLAKMSAANGTTVYVYNNDKTILVNTFCSARKAAEYFNVSYNTILKYMRNGLIFKEQWFFSTSLITS